MKIIKKLSAVLLAGAMSMCMFACTQNTEITETNGENNSSSSEGEKDNQGEVKTLNIAAEIIGESMDHTHDWDSWTTVRYCIAETLVKFGQDGSYQPWLAESWKSNEDATVWEFKLREDVVFSNGTPMTATKVKESIEFLYKTTDPNNGGMGYPQDFFTYTSIEANDEASTITITSDKPVIDMPGCMGYPWTCIVDTEGIEDRDLKVEGPIGTGAYQVSSYEKGNQLTLESNKNYWAGEVPFNNINAVYVTDAKTRAMSLMDGSADLSFNITKADRENLSGKNCNVEIASGSRIGNSYFNLDGVLKNEVIRKAITMSIDGPSIAEVTTAGSYVYDFAVIPTSYAFGGDELKFPYEYNPEKAKQLLDEEGIVDTNGDGIRELDGENITLDYVASNFRYLDVVPQAHMALIEEIGIDINLIPTDGHFDILNNRGFDIIVNSEVTMPTGDPQQFLGHWYTDGNNYSGYSNPKYDELYEELTTTVDTVKRAELIRDMQQILIDDAITIVWGFYGSNTCYTDKITDVVASTSDYYWITKDTKPTK